MARRRLNYANAIATLAVFAALGGVGYASYPNPTLAPGSVTTAKLADAAVGAPQLAPAAVGAGDLTLHAVGGSNLAPIYLTLSTFNGTGVIQGGGSGTELLVECPYDWTLLSGGFNNHAPAVAKISGSRRVGRAWAVSGVVPGSTGVEVEVYAYCLADHRFDR